MADAMSGAITTVRERRRLAVVVAASGSVAAAAIHAVTAAGHDGNAALVWLFAVCAVAQLVWGVAALLRPTRSVLVVGAMLNGSAAIAWLLSRTVGLPLIDSLAEREVVGLQDFGAAAFGAAAAGGALVALARPALRRRPSPAWAPLIGTAAIMLAIPVVAAGHAHGPSHDHSHGDEQLVAAAGHAHGDAADAAVHSDAHDSTAHDRVATGHEDHPTVAVGTTEDHHGTEVSASTTAGHEEHSPTAGETEAPHAAHPPTTPGQPEPPHADHPPAPPGEPPHVEHPPTGPIISIDDPRLTAAQRVAALNLLADTMEGLAAYPDVAAVEAAGYESIGDGGSSGFEHFVNWSYLADGHELDSSRIESIVAKKNGDGTKTIESALYILETGKTFADVPEIAGELTTWHDHQNLCWNGHRLAGVLVNGVCTPGGTFMGTPPMLHVWIVPHECGPFAGIEGHGTDCSHEH